MCYHLKWVNEWMRVSEWVSREIFVENIFHIFFMFLLISLLTFLIRLTPKWRERKNEPKFAMQLWFLSTTLFLKMWMNECMNEWNYKTMHTRGKRERERMPIKGYTESNQDISRIVWEKFFPPSFLHLVLLKHR